jgi:menaquinone-dependent protoporphyrinogen IX oxidase
MGYPFEILKCINFTNVNSWSIKQHTESVIEASIGYNLVKSTVPVFFKGKCHQLMQHQLAAIRLSISLIIFKLRTIYEHYALSLQRLIV